MPSFSCGAARRRAERRFAPGMRAAFLGRAAQRARETQTKGPGGKPPDARRYGLTEGSLKIGVSVKMEFTQQECVANFQLEIGIDHWQHFHTGNIPRSPRRDRRQ